MLYIPIYICIKKTIEETNRGKSLPEQRTKHSISTFWNHFFSIFGSTHSLLLSLRINGHTHISYILAYTDERRTHRRRRTMETNEQNEQTELVEGSQEGHLGSEYPLADTFDQHWKLFNSLFSQLLA